MMMMTTTTTAAGPGSGPAGSQRNAWRLAPAAAAVAAVGLLLTGCSGGTASVNTAAPAAGAPAPRATAAGNAAADEAFDGLGATWELYAHAFDRNSLDGAGLPLIASVHFGQDFQNAFWDGQQMIFGDGDGELFRGFTSAVDVIGHELTHGVVQYTAGLIYLAQPGALHESIADCFGSMVKQDVLGQDAAEADWLIGAGLFTDAVQGVALRSIHGFSASEK